MFNDDRAPILQALKQIDRSDSPEDVLKQFMAFAQPLGFEHFLISQMVNPHSAEFRRAMTFSNWPEELIIERMQNKKMLQDPIVQYSLRSRFFFSWDQAYEFASRYGRDLMQDARDHNIKSGFMFPMRRPGSPDGGVSIGAEIIDISPEETADLELATMHAYYRLEALHPPITVEEFKELSQQERDVLQFAASGKTIQDVATIMGISENGVKDAQRRAREKLNALNTMHAVTRAISRNLILP